MNHLELCITASTPQNRDELITLFQQMPGFLGVEDYALNESQIDQILGDRSYSGGNLDPDVIEEVEAINQAPDFKAYFEVSEEDNIKRCLAEYNHLSNHWKLKTNPNTDWNREWKSHFKPIWVQDDFVIVPDFEPTSLPSTEKFIIYPGMGFGTGHHETTFLCLSFILDFGRQAEAQNVLDYGSGSGILGLSWLKKHPQSMVDLVEIESEAHENAQLNLELNLLNSNHVRFLTPKDLLKPSYDLILANILEPVLIDCYPIFAQHARPGTTLILSGILNDQADHLISFYTQQLEWDLVTMKSKGDWSAVVLKRR